MPDFDPESRQRKPIYDDLPAAATADAVAAAPAARPTSETPSGATTTSATPTDRLAGQIRLARLFVHEQAVKAEDATNRTMTRLLRLEHSFTSTIASLAPPRESKEKLLPNGLYVLVAAMAGSILVRNRNVLLRALVPPAVGVGAAYAVIPHTMNNVGQLAWSYEERFPAVASAHLRARERVGRFVETGKAHSQMGFDMAEQKVGGVRKAVEDWVRQGK